MSYVSREHYKIHHKTSEVYYANITEYRGEATYMVVGAHAPTTKEKSRANYPKF